MSRATVLGDAVVTALNGESFSQAFTSTRKYRPIMTLKAIKNLTVTVLIPAVVQSIISRGSNTDVITVDILVQQQANPDDNTVIDALMNLCEEIAEFFRDVNFSNTQWRSTEIVSVYDIEDLSEWQAFTALVRLEYRVVWSK